MSKFAEIAFNLLIVVLTFIVMMILGWIVKKSKGVFNRNKNVETVDPTVIVL